MLSQLSLPILCAGGNFPLDICAAGVASVTRSIPGDSFLFNVKLRRLRLEAHGNNERGSKY